MRVTESNRETREQQGQPKNCPFRFQGLGRVLLSKMLFKCSESRKLVFTINLPLGELSYLETKEEPDSLTQSQLVSNVTNSLFQWNWLYSKMSPRGIVGLLESYRPQSLVPIFILFCFFVGIALCNAYSVVDSK